jgi:hypothetical protein
MGSEKYEKRYYDVVGRWVPVQILSSVDMCFMKESMYRMYVLTQGIFDTRVIGDRIKFVGPRRFCEWMIIVF